MDNDYRVFSPWLADSRKIMVEKILWNKSNNFMKASEKRTGSALDIEGPGAIDVHRAPSSLSVHTHSEVCFSHLLGVIQVNQLDRQDSQA